MLSGRREILWLIALEATLSFSEPVWLPSSWNNPARDPLEFIVALLAFVLSALIAALMTQAGVHRYWKPSLFQDLTYALLGPDGGHKASAWHAIQALVGVSLAGPALLCAVSIRFLSLGFSIAKKITLAVCALAVVVWLLFTQANLSFYPPYDLTLSLWAVLLALLGVAAGVACFLHRSTKRT
jgi:hypothetical protein